MKGEYLHNLCQAMQNPPDYPEKLSIKSNKIYSYKMHLSSLANTSNTKQYNILGFIVSYFVKMNRMKY